MTEQNQDALKQIKKYNEWLKGGFGTMAMLNVMNLIFVIRALSKKDLNLWLEFEFTKFAFKNTSFFNGCSGSLPLWAALTIVITLSLALLGLSMNVKKHNALIVPVSVIYILDSALLTFVMAMNYFGDYSASSWINVITHAIMLLLLLSSLYAYAKKRKMPKELIAAANMAEAEEKERKRNNNNNKNTKEQS